MTTPLRRKATRWTPKREDVLHRALLVLAHDEVVAGRILTRNRALTMSVVTSGEFPAWSMGPHMYLNEARATPMVSDYDIGVMRGLCKHEHGHTYLTPSLTEMRDAVRRDNKSGVCMLADLLEANSQSNHARAWNMLEDQRQETLYLAEFPDFKDYLVLAFTHYIVGDGKDMSNIFLLSRGRRYLPRSLRIRARRRFKDQSYVKEIADIIDQYRVLNLFRGPDLDKAYHLVMRFEMILRTINPTNPIPPEQGAVCSCPTLIQNGRGQDNAQQRHDVTATAILKVKASEKSGQDGKPGKADADGEPTTTGDTTPDGDSSGSGAGSGDSKPTDDPSKTDSQVIQDAVNGSAGSNEVRDSARRVRVLIKNQDDGIDPNATRQQTWGRVPPALVAQAAKVVKELRKVEEDTDPYWLTHTTYGRLNIQRAMRSDPGREDLHDAWQDAQLDGSDMELVVLLDVSPSMRSHYTELSYCAWVIKRACDQLRIRCTIIAYATHHAIVYGPSEKADPKKYPSLDATLGSSTIPGMAVLAAHKVLLKSRRRMRALVTLTDGIWASAVPVAAARKYGAPHFLACSDVVDDLNGRGVLTALAFFGAELAEMDPHARASRVHKHHHYRNIASVADMALFTRDQIVRGLRQGVRR